MSPEQARLLERAAALEGCSLTDFVLSSAQAAALASVERPAEIVITAGDSQIFAQALMQPPAPNERLRLGNP